MSSSSDKFSLPTHNFVGSFHSYKAIANSKPARTCWCCSNIGGTWIFLISLETTQSTTSFLRQEIEACKRAYMKKMQRKNVGQWQRDLTTRLKSGTTLRNSCYPWIISVCRGGHSVETKNSVYTIFLEIQLAKLKTKIINTKQLTKKWVNQNLGSVFGFKTNSCFAADKLQRYCKALGPFI